MSCLLYCLRPRKPLHSSSKLLHENSKLQMIPTEMVQHIASFLPYSSAACLALASRHLRSCLGQQYLPILGSDHFANIGAIEHNLFLSLLERDLPGYTHCEICRILHPVYGTEGLRYSSVELIGWVRRGWPCIDMMEKARVTWGYDLSWRAIQLVMRRHHLGGSYWISIENLCRHTQGMDTVEARIIEDELYLRMEVHMSIPRPEIHLPNLWFCPHSVTSHISSNDFVQNIRCGASHFQQTTCPTCSGVKRCPACFMEYTIQKEGRYGILVTAWHNFGAGKDKLDPKWKSHVETFGENDSMHWIPVDFAPGSICRAWEDKTTNPKIQEPCGTTTQTTAIC